MQCNEIMTRHPKFVTLAQPIHAAAAMMHDSDAGFLPVCDDAGKVVGTLTDRDIVIRLVAQKRSSDTSVAEVMTSGAVTCDATTTVEQAEAMLREHKISRLACVNDAQELIGVIGISDLIAKDDASAAQDMVQDIKSAETGV